MRPFLSAALLMSAALAAASPASAQAVGGAAERYVSLSAGYVGETEYDYTVGSFPTATVESELESGYAVSGAVGARYSPNVRTEVALAYRSQDGVSRARGSGAFIPSNPEAKVNAFSLDLNGYYDLPTAGAVRPYLGVGAGIAQIELQDIVLDDSSSVLNLQAMAGVSAAISPRASVFAEARYQRLGTIKVETQFGASSGEDEFAIDNLGVFAGVRFGF